MFIIKVKDPPHLGFSKFVIKSSSEHNKKLRLVLKRVENTINILTSIPNLNTKLESAMDISFSKYYQNVAEQLDNDSGYVSQNQESVSESLLENASREQVIFGSNIKTIYLSEDALLEKPELKSNVNMSLTDQDSLRSNEEIEASVSTESEHFSVLRCNESDFSDVSNTSAIIPKIDTITIINKSLSSEEISDISDESNAENNMNVSNVSNNTSINTSNYSERSYTKGLDNENKENIFCMRDDESTDTSFAKSRNISMTVLDTCGPLSPELFSDEETSSNRTSEKYKNSFVCEEKYILKQDKKLIKKVQSALSGVLPPPSLTSIHLTAAEILEIIKRNQHLLCTNNSTSSNGAQEPCAATSVSNKSVGTSSLLLSTNDEHCVAREFPDILNERYHGLHYNRSKLSENFEMLCMKYAERWVANETQSTCTVFQQPVLSSPLKRKANRLRWAVKSPGKRLSHLAKRRITFSSANLQATAGTSNLNTHSRQIAMDPKRFHLLSRKRSPLKKSPRKTPRKTPKKSPRKKIRTPSSSAKKILSQQLQLISGQNTEVGSAPSRASATKRALFQSPDKISITLSKSLFPSTSGTSSISPFKRRMTPKCALFTSPSKNSTTKIDNKRKRIDSDDTNPSKLFRSVSLQDCGSSNSCFKKDILKVKSETNISASQQFRELSDHHQKKLKWAIYETLRSQNIGINHPQFKQFASVLARVTRRFLPNLAANVPRPEGGTSEKMLRIARQHIYAVMKGKSVDEIMQEFQISRKNTKPVGYVGLEGIQNDTSTTRNKENVFRDRLNTMSNEKQKLGLSRDELIKTTLTRVDNRVDRARRMINFDGENSSDIR